MAKKPPFLKVVIEIVAKFFLSSNIEGIKKIRPIVLLILTIISTVLLAIFSPESLVSVLQFLINLL